MAPPRSPPASVPTAFLQVVDRVEPVAETLCRAEVPQLDCNFLIFVDLAPDAGVNALHTTDRRGRPLIVISAELIAQARNADELAFVIGHEAGHHIAQHIPGQRRQAALGAQVFGQIARSNGADLRSAGEAAELGALVAARRFSQGAELEADVIGTLIAFRAGYDPLRGARFFDRLPDPEGGFLSTHPPNDARQDIVRDTVAILQGGAEGA
jgi:predicted Zn-dependent protease